MEGVYPMRPLQLEIEYRRSDRQKVRFIDLVRPENRTWRGDIHAQTSFALYGWVVHLLNPLYENRCNHIPPFLSAHPGVLSYDLDPFGRKWRDELWMRFHYILLSGECDPVVRAMLDAEQLHIGGERYVSLPRYIRLKRWFGHITEIRMDDILDALFGLEGRMLNVSLNSSWPEAREIEGVDLHVRSQHLFAVQMWYRIPSDSSHWDF